MDFSFLSFFSYISHLFIRYPFDHLGFVLKNGGCNVGKNFQCLIDMIVCINKIGKDKEKKKGRGDNDSSFAYKKYKIF